MKKFNSKIKAYNEMAMVINEIVPAIIDRLSQGFKIKADGELFKKDNDDIKKLLEPTRERGITSWLDCRHSYIAVRFKRPYYFDGGNDWLDEFYYVARMDGSIMTFEPEETINIDEALENRNAVSIMRDQISELESQISICKTRYKLD